MNRKLLACTLFLLGASAHAEAVNKYPLQELIKSALEYQPSVAISYYEKEKSLSALQTAKADLYPKLDHTTSVTNDRKASGSNDFNVENKITLSYRLADFGVRDANVNKFRHDNMATDTDYLKSKTLVAKEVTTSYLNINRGKETLDGIKKEKVFYKKMMENFALLVSSGVAMESDLRKVQISIDTLNTREITYQSMLDTELFKLKNMVGIDLLPEQVDETSALFINYHFEQDRKKVLSEVTNSNYDYKMLVSARKAAMEEVKAAKSSYYPTVDINTGYSQNNPGGSSNKSDHEDQFNIGLNVKFNLFDGFRNSAQDLKVASNHTQSQLRLDDFILQTKYNIDSLVSKYNASTETYAINKRSYDNALSLSALYEQEFQLGQKSLLDLISSRNESFQAYISMIEGQYNMYDVKLQQLVLVSKLNHYLGVDKMPINILNHSKS
ncbi:outer membrane channel protein [Yersinia mollaretii]|uniref:TolC family protein n=1 Tax=Yersinia mollaretii TaxID=33060 RepID=UPI0005E6DDDD|nr:TolC family protein [Yersinia mollaretii]CNK59800.1 outer membrane channel protein [Yersinia mollaretii]